MVKIVKYFFYPKILDIIFYFKISIYWKYFFLMKKLTFVKTLCSLSSWYTPTNFLTSVANKFKFSIDIYFETW